MCTIVHVFGIFLCTAFNCLARQLLHRAFPSALFGVSERERLRLGVRRGFEHGERGAEAEGRSCGVIVKKVVENVGCAGGQMNHAIVPCKGLFARGPLGFAGKSRESAAPVADGIAMNAGCRGRIDNRSAIGQERQHLVLCRSKGPIGGELWELRFGYWRHRKGTCQPESS